MPHPLFYDSTAALQSAHEAGTEARRAATKVDILRGDVERLLMITEALWMMLKEQHGYTDEQLHQRVMQIDLRDGKLDGRVKVTEPPIECPECGRTLNKKRMQCLYCGAHVMQDPFTR